MTDRPGDGKPPRGRWRLDLLLEAVAVRRARRRMAWSAGELAHRARLAHLEAENARLREEMERVREALGRAEAWSTVGSLAAEIAHEIRNPLVSMQAFFQIAERRLGDEELASFARLAAGEVERINQLIEEMLALGRSAAAPVAETPQACVGEVVGRVLTLLAPHARAGRVELAQRDLQGPLLTVRIEPDRLVQVLLNIGLNGLQATPPGGRVAIEAAHDECGQSCRITISDGGPGITAAVRALMFEPFFTTKETGTGLGLPVAARLVTGAGGRIEVESVDGRGSRFAVYLPAA